MAARLFSSALTSTLLLSVLCLHLASHGFAADSSADRIYFGGTIVTMDSQRRIVDAVAVKDGKILQVGSEVDIRKLAGTNTALENLHGATMTPGFYAAHDHFPSAGTVELYQAKLFSPPVGDIKTIA